MRWLKEYSFAKSNWVMWTSLSMFVVLTVISVFLPLYITKLQDSIYIPLFNATLSIGTSGIASFIFYYFVNQRLERQSRLTVRTGALHTYRNAKRDIALAIIQSSISGGRRDLSADSDTIEKIMAHDGFIELFRDGREADEGFYAFENEMMHGGPEFSEILLNLNIIKSTIERLISNIRYNDLESFLHLSHISARIARIERNGYGYDESKYLCRLIWEIFAGWSYVKGPLGHDPIERVIQRFKI